jgi:serine/threonine-protein kinase RsbW
LSRLLFAAEDAHINEAMMWIEAQCAVNGLGREIAACLAVVSEEVITNIVKYGGRPAPNVELTVSYLPPSVQLTVIDDGVPFDPTSAPELELSDDIELRSAGGLGLRLIREMMDEVAYARDGGRNYLVLVKHVGPKP